MLILKHPEYLLLTTFISVHLKKNFKTFKNASLIRHSELSYDHHKFSANNSEGNNHYPNLDLEHYYNKNNIRIFVIFILSFFFYHSIKSRFILLISEVRIPYIISDLWYTTIIFTTHRHGKLEFVI